MDMNATVIQRKLWFVFGARLIAPLGKISHPFNPVPANPATNLLCSSVNNVIIGRAPSIALAIIFPHSELH